VEGEVGTFALHRGGLLAGHELASGLDLSAAMTWLEAYGADLYFPEWDTPLTPGGISRGADWARGHGLYAAVGFRGWKAVGFLSERDKGTPTAPFGSNFGDPTGSSTDRRFFGEISVDRDLSPGRSVFARAYYDGSYFSVTYPFAGSPDAVGEISGRWLGVEGRFRWDPHPAYRFTTGAEARRNRHARIDGADPLLGNPEGDFPSTVLSGYAQADLQLHQLVQLTLGGRVDHYSTVGTATSPRGGLVVHALDGTTIKALYGEAFRAPNQAELNVHAPPFLRRNPDVRPERIRTFELVVEQRVSRDVYATISAYDYTLTDLIVTITDPLDGALSFLNAGAGNAKGLELAVDARPSPELSLRAGYAHQRPRRDGSSQVPNAPAHSLRASVASSLVPNLDVGVQAIYDSNRRGHPGRQDTDSYLLTNTNLTTRLFGRLDLALAVENLLDTRYAHPAGYEYLQDAHPQDGRSFRLGFDFTF
jgi:iron complex outermembrane receptor protein